VRNSVAHGEYMMT